MCFLFLFQVEKDVTDLMLKALKYCDVDTPTLKQPSYQYRAATIHHRLASLYHNAFRNQVSYSCAVLEVINGIEVAD